MIAAAKADEPGIRRKNVLGMLVGLRALGMDTGALLERLGLGASEIDALPRRLPPQIMFRLWQAVEQSYGDRSLGIQLAERVQIEHYDVFGYVVATSATLGDALLRGVRLFGLVSETLRFSLELDAQRTAILLESHPSSPLHPQAAEFLVAAGVTVGRQLAGRRLPHREVRFTHGAPRDAGYLEQFFGAVPRFGAPWNGLVIDTAYLSLPVAGHDPARHAELQKRAEQLLAEVEPGREIERLVLDAVALCLREGHEPSLERVSEMIEIHPKALDRRLRQNGTKYRDLLARFRMRLAERYLLEPGMSVTEVAFRLGYSEKRNFNRAFRRWTGQTPSEYRSGAGG